MWNHSDDRIDGVGVWGAFLEIPTAVGPLVAGAVKAAGTEVNVDLTTTGIRLAYEMPSQSFPSGGTRTEVYKQMHELSLSFAGPVEVTAILRGGTDKLVTTSDTTARELAPVIVEEFTIKSAVAAGDTLVALPAFRTLCRFLYLDILSHPTGLAGTAALRHFSELDEERY